MSNQSQDPDARLERAASQIAGSRPDEAQVRAAAARVWERLSEDSAHAAAGAAEIDQIRGCDDYQALIPAYLAGVLPQARKLLLEDHTRECVPCRRALKTAREGKTVSPARPATSAEVVPIRPFFRWALAAALLAGIAATPLVIRELMPFAGPSATVQTVDGDLFRVAATSHLPIAAGDEVREGETIRTGREGGAVVELHDGSLLELRERSEISIDEGRRGTTIELERGSVIVQAAKQRSRHLYVATEDCLVSVTGTTFVVNKGTRGSRVSVIEGEVRVNYAGDETVLEPGQQVATQDSLDAVPVGREIAWSRNVNEYLELLREFTDLHREIQQVPRPGLRYNSRLLDLMPESTVFYAAVPNLGETITETRRVLQDRLAESPVLNEWLQSQGHEQFEPMVDEVVSRLGEFSEYLGNELVVSGQAVSADQFEGPLVLAEIVDAAGFRDFVEQQLGDPMFEHEGEEHPVTFIEDPFTPPAGHDGILLWLHDDLLVGSPEPAQIQQVAAFVLQGAENPFVGSPFYNSILALYEEGAGILIAADLGGVVETHLAGDGESRQSEHFEHLGFRNVRHLVLEQKRVGQKTHHRAALSFHEARQGVASWLAEPAPMGSLDFISPDAKLVAAFVVKDPAKLLDDLTVLHGGEEGFQEALQLFEDRHDLSLRDDFAASLGGEFAFAVDGPFLPEPAWKLVVEVYDPARLQWTIEQAVAELNEHLAQEGEPAVEIRIEEVGGRTFYTLPTGVAEIHYTFVEGYLVAAPSRAHLDRAIRFRNSGYSITDASRFTALLPADGRNNFSGLVYQDLGAVMQAVAERLAQAQGEGLSPEQQQNLDAVKAESKPTLGYAYGETDRIILAAASEGDALSSLLLRLLGVQNPVGIEQLLQEAIGGVL